MKYCLRYLLMAMTVALCSMHCVADETTSNDTVYFYDTWGQMLYQEPVALIVNPDLVAVTPYEVYFDTGDQELDWRVESSHLAISVSDSIWLMSSSFLKNDFKGDTKNLSGYVPVFFNDKVAYIAALGPLSVKELLLGNSYLDDAGNYNYDYYYIDFQNHKIKRVTHEYLSELLEDYHDLQMRYEGMKDYKKRHIIEDYFLKYIDRATQDIMHPYILDLVE